MELIEVGDLTGRMLGLRVAVVKEGSVVSGVLDSFWARTGYGDKREMSFVKVATDIGLYELKGVPMDFVIEIDFAEAAES